MIDNQKALSPEHEKLRSAFATMRAVSHPLRLKIIQLIDNNAEMKVRDIYSLLSIEQALVSQQLRILRLAEVVHSRRSQKFIFYRLNYDKLALVAHNAPLLAVLVQQ